MELIHESQLSELEDPRTINFIIDCTSDNFGKLIEQPSLPYTIVEEFSPMCSDGNAEFVMPSLQMGNYKIFVQSSEYGQAANAVDIEYNFEVSSIFPTACGTGGGTLVSISGTGFSEMTTATLCGQQMTYISYAPAVNANDEEVLVFETLPVPDVSACNDAGLEIYEVDRSDGTQDSATLAGARKRRSAGGLTVDPALTPQITMVYPKKGGTAGGTSLTITGTGFSNNAGDVTVTIFDVACDVQTATTTEIVCVTNAFPKGVDQVPIEPVVNIDGGPGSAIPSGSEDAKFWYIDRWSSPYTWGCGDASCKPQEGEIIVIPKGQVILLDEVTPILAVLLIDGGTMIWDHSPGIELHMQYGIVNSGGHFQIGTEEEPFCEESALIKMYGHQRSINLPIYGAKVFAIRFGTIDIHGCPITTTWTELETTVEVNATEITLTHPVKDDWKVGNDIIIAATGDITNFHRNEKRTIASVSEDGYTIGLTEPLEHRHLAVCQNGPDDNGEGFGWAGEVCMRAEVGLLTRNVKMMGNKDNSWQQNTPQCKQVGGGIGAAQSCFQDRFGEETGADQFGSVLFIHKPYHAKIEYFEVTHAGQAFNLARYPIHFHTPGMSCENGVSFVSL